MAANLYHLLGFMPAIERFEMPPRLEALAQQLVRTGKLRINAEHERNFVRYGTSSSDLTFTARELTDPALLATTRARAQRLVAPAAGQHGFDALWAHLLAELKKARGVSAEKEIRVARVLVQSAHPAVIQLLIASGTELFVSYSHNVADLMPVHEWENNGTASGLQATDIASTAVYVSAGGDPFFEGEQKTYTTDGFPALARMVVIAGQELGHFADLRRSPRGIIGRHSTDPNHSQLRANPVAREGRLSDIQTVIRLSKAYHRAGLGFLRRAEKGLTFYHAKRRYSPPWLFYQILRLLAWGWFKLQCKINKLNSNLQTLPYHRLGEAIELYLSDMAFNLAPEAEVYSNPDPLIEEAIAVIEAVARVPQQVHKWGYSSVAAAWPRLSHFYDTTIIPACEAAVREPMQPQTIGLLQKLTIALRHGLRARPGYYP